MDANPKTRARTLLTLLWRKYDAGGISMGRSYEAVLLEAAMDLLGPPDRRCAPPGYNGRRRTAERNKKLFVGRASKARRFDAERRRRIRGWHELRP